MRLFNCALSSTGGYDSYTWQGPPGSGVSGSTLTTITSSVSGTYSLSALSGTTTYSQTVNVTFYALPSITVSASTSQVCAGTTVTLQALSGTQNTYTWNTGAVSESITVTPMNTYIYTAMGTNPFGCVYSVVKTITVVSLPNISIVPVSPVICPTQTINLAAISDYTPSAFCGILPLLNSAYPLVLLLQQFTRFLQQIVSAVSIHKPCRFRLLRSLFFS